jgi:hypothetical protein
VALPDLVNPILHKFRTLRNFVQNPVRIFSQRARLEGQKAYENFEISRPKSRELNGRGKEIADLPPELASDAPRSSISNTFRDNSQDFFRQYENGKIESDRDFPYDLLSFYQQTETSQIYKGIHKENDKLIFIFEYFCDRIDLPREEIEETLEELVESFSLSPLQRDKFRLIIPTNIARRSPSGDTIYAIAERPKKSWTLREHLEYVENVDRKSAIAIPQVVRFLDLVLQSLWFLHHYQLRLSQETLQLGLAHGNLTLDNLLWVANEDQSNFSGQNFWIYLFNLQVFTDFRYLLKEKAASQTEKQKDLKCLGEIGFNLWLGKTENIKSLRKEDQKLFESLRAQKSQTLYDFLQDLEGGNFASADVARNKLISLKEKIEREFQDSVERDQSILPLTSGKQKRQINWLVAIAVSCGSFLIAFMIAKLALRTIGVELPNPLTRLSQKTEEIIDEKNHECYIANIEGVETLMNSSQLGLFEKESNWERIFSKTGLVAANDTNLEAKLKQKLRLNYDRIFVTEPSKTNILKILANQQERFALMRGMNFSELKEHGLQQTIVAYDALVFFIPFNNHYVVKQNFDNNLTIETTQLERQIYLEGIIDFDRFLIDENNLRIIRDSQDRQEESSDAIDYVPFERDAREFFVEKMQQKQIGDSEVLQNWLIEKIKQQKQQIQSSQPLTTYDIFGTMFAEYNNKQTKSLGFGWLSMVLGQCSVYPLAYGQQVVKNNYDRALSPQIDLCDDKGSYWGSPDEIEKYEFSYPLAVVYPQDSEIGEKFADLLLTLEGQFLLREAGLIPAINLPNTAAEVTIKEGGQCQI